MSEILCTMSETPSLGEQECGHEFIPWLALRKEPICTSLVDQWEGRTNVSTSTTEEDYMNRSWPMPSDQCASSFSITYCMFDKNNTCSTSIEI